MSAWNLIRTLVAAAADPAGPPLAAAGVALPSNSSIVEFRVRNLVTTGDPTSLVLFYWRIQTGTVELIGTEIIQTPNNGMPEPKRVISESPMVYVTIGFTGGTNPTASGTIEARGLFGLTDAGIIVTPSPLAVFNMLTDPGHNYSCSRADASAVRINNTTFTFTGPAITSMQLRRVRIFIDANTRPLDWIQDVNAVLSIAAGVITVVALDGTAITVPAAATYIDTFWEAQDKAFNSTLNANNNAPMYSDRSFRTSTTPTSLIPAAQLFTTAWVALGPQFQVDGEKWLRGFFSWTKNNGTATTFQIRAYFSHTFGGTQFPCKVVKVDTSAVPYVVSLGDEIITLATVDQSDLATVTWDLQNSVGYVQLYIYAATPGAAGGAGPGAMATAEYTVGY